MPARNHYKTQKRRFQCVECHKFFARDEVVPPKGAILPPGYPRRQYRCSECHAVHLARGLRLALARSSRYHRS